MPGVNPGFSDEDLIASLLRRVSALEDSVVPAAGGGGFDPNADPVVIGSGANGNGFSGSIVLGLYAYGNAYDLVVAGRGADAESDGAIAIGANAYVPAGCDSAVAIGYAATALASTAITIGHNATTNSSASGSIAIGSGTVVRDANATAVGQGAFIAAGHTWSTAIGHGTVTTKARQIMLGTAAEFVEIAGTGIVFTDTITGTRKMLTLASGGVSWVTAP